MYIQDSHLNNQLNQSMREVTYKMSHKYLSIIKYVALYILISGMVNILYFSNPTQMYDRK